MAKFVSLLVGMAAGTVLSLISIRYEWLPPNVFGYEPSQTAFERLLTRHQLRLSRYHTFASFHFFGASTIQALNVQKFSKDALNFGIGGETTAGLALRLPLYNSLRKASAVFIQSGYNDKNGLSLEETKKNYAAIFNTIPDHTDIYVITFQPARAESSGHVDPYVLLLNELLKNVCANEPRCTLLDLFTPLTKVEEPVLESDNIHLNAKGYEVLSQIIIQSIEQFGTSKPESTSPQ